MKELRITVRCLLNPIQHAKVVRVKARLGRRRAEELAELLDGTSLAYVHPPGPQSPVGRCVVCGGECEAEVSEVIDGKEKLPSCADAVARMARREKAAGRRLLTEISPARKDVYAVTAQEPRGIRPKAL
jgi:hypothetical protein